MIPQKPKKNYVNNRDLLKEIHLSKNSYCAYRDPVIDHQYDIILSDVSRINQRTVAEARRNRADRIKKETGEIIDPKKIANTDLVFRVTCWEHIPMAPKKTTRAQTKKNTSIQELFEIEEDEELFNELLAEDAEVINEKYVWLNFPPFWHYRLDENKEPYVVGKSHWRGDLETGEFSREHGAITRTLADMFLKLAERYGTRSNWRGYTYNDEMKGQALLQLSMVGLKFDESKSQNPFAYYTAAITNSFTRVLNLEKKMQNIRDDILEENGLTPSWTRQNSQNRAIMPGPVTITRYKTVENDEASE